MQQQISQASETFRKRLIATAKGSRGAKDMSREEASEALTFLMSSEAHPAQVGAFLTAMRFKGAKVEEMKGFLDAMEASATLISPNVDGLLNCNGPYDGRKHALHLSLAAAIVTVAAGVPVVMHSNSGLPPKNGVTTAQLLEMLGIPAYHDPEQVMKDIEETGFGHLHASCYLHGVERLKPIRQTLFYRSLLHACEVMINPAGARYSLIGAAHKSFLERFATAAGERGQQRVMAVQGLDGCDELPMKPVAVADYNKGLMTQYTLDPADYGFDYQEHHPCVSPEMSAQAVKRALTGVDDRHLSSIIYNAGIRLDLSGHVENIAEGIKEATHTIESGQAATKLKELQQ
ncbi:MAG: anthranilate phosphoribosyltransferase [Candidatus Thiodiazotropha sp. (ex Lucinoma borealis)]|nr:anthranilate phosphoribosyltransferase [Candidatus Thiodiazotropha sp. (ex Lucinoma borealis)]MCU7873089.1 anthranilate phosphoribosyltransferase [Candidatus Thiodiazotropha sp. (ex Lucinoma borealis)]